MVGRRASRRSGSTTSHSIPSMPMSRIGADSVVVVGPEDLPRLHPTVIRIETTAATSRHSSLDRLPVILFSKGPLITFVVVLNSLNIVFTEIGSTLHFKEDNRKITGITNPMRNTLVDVHRFSRPQHALRTVDDDQCFACGNHPGFFTLAVCLIAEAMTRMNEEALYFVTRSFFEDLPKTPGANTSLV